MKRKEVIKEIWACLSILSVIALPLGYSLKSVGEVKGLELYNLYVDEFTTINQIRMIFDEKAILIVEESDYDGEANYHYSNKIPLIQYLSDKRINASYEGKIAMAVDLEDANIHYNGNIIEVEVKKPYLYDHQLEMKIIDSDDSIFNHFIYSDFDNLENNIKVTQLQEAIDQGLYEKADQSLENQLNQLISSIAGYDVKVRIQYK